MKQTSEICLKYVLEINFTTNGPHVCAVGRHTTDNGRQTLQKRLFSIQVALKRKFHGKCRRHEANIFIG